MLKISIDMESNDLVGKTVDALYFLGFDKVETELVQTETEAYTKVKARTESWKLEEKEESIGFKNKEGKQ